MAGAPDENIRRIPEIWKCRRLPETANIRVLTDAPGGDEPQDGPMLISLRIESTDPLRGELLAGDDQFGSFTGWLNLLALLSQLLGAEDPLDGPPLR